MKFQLSMIVIIILFVLSNKAEAQWERSMLYPNSAGAHSVKFIDQNNEWAAGTDISFNDILLSTTNGGSTWIDRDMNTTYDFSSLLINK